MTVPPGPRLTEAQFVPVMVHPVAPQVQLRDPESKFCAALLKASVRLREPTVPPPTFATVPLIG